MASNFMASNAIASLNWASWVLNGARMVGRWQGDFPPALLIAFAFCNFAACSVQI